MHDEKIRSQMTDHLMEAILSLENTEEAYSFFEDLCTIAEIRSMSQRFEVARMLREKRTYQEIGRLTGASTATISRVNRALVWGEDGYTTVLGRMKDIDTQPLTEDEV